MTLDILDLQSTFNIPLYAAVLDSMADVLAACVSE